MIFALSSCSKNEKESPIVARVGESVLSLEQIINDVGSYSDSIFYGNELERYVYRWINDEIFYQAGVAEGIVSLPVIQDELRKVRRALIINNYLEQKLGIPEKIPEAQLREYYEENRDAFVRDKTEYRYSFLICKDRNQAQILLRDIRKDSSFAELVKKNHPEKVLNIIWDSDYVSLEGVIPSIQKIIERLNPGATYGPVASETSFVVFKLEEKFDSGSVRKFELVENKIKIRLQEDWYREQYQQLLVSLKNKKRTEIILQNAEKVIIPNTSSVKN